MFLEQPIACYSVAALLTGYIMAPHLGRMAARMLGLTEPQPPLQATLGRGGRVEEDIRLLHPTAGTYPRLCRLSDQSILCGFTHIEAGQHVLSISRSIDNGSSFAPWGEVARSPGDCDNLFLLPVPHQPERVLAAFRNHDQDHQNRPIHFRITVCESSDGGRTWTFSSQAAEKSAPLGLWEPFMRVGRQGQVQLYYSQELAHDDQDTMVVTSYDRGTTWSAPRCVTGMGLKLRDGMTGVASTFDNGQEAMVMVFETTRHRTFSIECVISYDDGETWGYRQVVYCPKNTRNAGAPQIESFADGSLAVVFMSDEDSHSQDWPRHASIKVVFAGPPAKGHISWCNDQVVHGPTCAWPGIMRIHDYSSLAAFEHNGAIRGRMLTWGDAAHNSR